MLNFDKIYHVKQPIYDTKDEKTIGYEVFIRHKDNKNPLELFQLARQQNKLNELDSYNIEKFLFHTYKPGEEDVTYFLNVFPSTILQERFHDIITKFPDLEKVVFEINEANEEQEVWSSEQFFENIRYYKKKFGVKFALDDLGKGQSTLQNIIETEPDYVKLDKYFSHGLSSSSKKQKIVSSLMEISQSFQSKMILEGIETLEDYQTAKHLHVEYLQGYLLGKPKSFDK